MRIPRRFLALAPALALPLAMTGSARGTTPTFTTVRLSGADGNTEPRVAAAPDGTLHVVTSSGGSATVYSSTDLGATWGVRGTFPNQTEPSIDVDVIALPEGRLIASELDLGGINFRNAYSDDGGTTWHLSAGATLADTDRQWLAYGPVNAVTGKRVVYVLWHNLASGLGNHNMYVQTSLDGGETFLPPVPTTLPGSQAYADLQCADSSGPSGIAVNQTTGQVYVLFGTRTSPVAPSGGCGASVTPGPVSINVVPPTRLWVATSTDGVTWSQSLAVDRSATGQVVGTQLGSIAVDTSGNAYVAFTESVSGSDFRSALKYVHAGASLSSWSAPVTVAALAENGNILPHVVAGAAGKLGFAWLHGKSDGNWYAMVAQTLDGLAATPTIGSWQVSTVVAYSGSAASLMGLCTTGTLSGVENGFVCERSPDVFGIAVDSVGRIVSAWPGRGGTYVTTQQTGDLLY